MACSLAPVIGARLILTKGYSDAELNLMTAADRVQALAKEVETLIPPYFILGTLLVLIAVIFTFTKLPKIQNSSTKSASQSIFMH